MKVRRRIKSGKSSYWSLLFAFFVKPFPSLLLLLLHALFISIIIIPAPVVSVSALSSGPRIVTPQSNRDWQQLSILISENFDAPTNSNTTTLREQVEWYLYEKMLTERSIYDRYQRLAKDFKGTKYGIYVAKPSFGMMNSKTNNIDDVLGVVELGMTLGPPSSTPNHNTTNETSSSSILRRIPRATLGVLCVKKEYRSMGIGKALVDKCEHEARTVWNETSLFVEVEPKNTDALQFFRTKCGFKSSSSHNNTEIKNATITKRRKVEVRPHLVLSRKLE